jgi:hypothetical protein
MLPHRHGFDNEFTPVPRKPPAPKGQIGGVSFGCIHNLL